MTILETKKKQYYQHTPLPHSYVFFFYPQHVKCKNTKEFYNLADILKKDNILLSKNLIYLLIKNVTESVRNSDTFLDI